MSQQLFESADYKINVKTEPGCQVNFNIQVGLDATMKFLKKAVKIVNKEVSLPGFRKGKAPEEVIKSHFGKQVEKEWKDLVVQESFVQAIHMTNLRPFNKESVQNVKIISISKENGTEIEIFFESLPQIPEIDLKTISLESHGIEPITDTKIQQIVEDIRYQNADWENVEGRAVQEGDFIDVDIEDIDNPGKFLCQDFRLEVARGKIGTWLFDVLIGQNPGDSKEAMSRLEEGVTNSEFKATHCRVTVKSIKASLLPPIDDALAQKVGLKSKEELYEKVKQNLEKQHIDVAKEKNRHSLGKVIAEAYQFEVPYSIVTSHTQKLISERTQKLRQSNPDVDIRKLEEIESNTKKEVEAQVRWQFITQKIAREKNIQVSKQEVLSELILQGYIDPKTGNSKASIDENPEDVMNNIYSNILMDKVADIMLREANA